MVQQSIPKTRRQDLFVRNGNTAPTTPTLLQLAGEPDGLREDLFTDFWRPWIAFGCGDGRWVAITDFMVAARNAGGTDQPSPLGGIRKVAEYLRAGDKSALRLVVDEIDFAHDHHGVVAVQLIAHPLCGATRVEVCKAIPEASSIYRSPTKGDPQLFYSTMMAELGIQRSDFDKVRRWIFQTFPFIVAVQYLRVTKYRLTLFSDHELAVAKAVQELKSQGNWTE